MKIKKLLLTSIIVLSTCIPVKVYANQPFTLPSLRVKSDHGIIYLIATMKTSQYESQYDKARALYNFVIDYMSYDEEQALDKENPKYIYTSTEALYRRKGICYEYALFYAALCRAIGIPTQVAKGNVQLGEESYYHAWNRILIDNNWISVDPTLGDVSEDCRNKFFDFDSSDREITGVE